MRAASGGDEARFLQSAKPRPCRLVPPTTVFIELPAARSMPRPCLLRTKPACAQIPIALAAGRGATPATDAPAGGTPGGARGLGPPGRTHHWGTVCIASRLARWRPSRCQSDRACTGSQGYHPSSIHMCSSLAQGASWWRSGARAGVFDAWAEPRTHRGGCCVPPRAARRPARRMLARRGARALSPGGGDSRAGQPRAARLAAPSQQPPCVHGGLEVAMRAVRVARGWLLLTCSTTPGRATQIEGARHPHPGRGQAPRRAQADLRIPPLTAVAQIPPTRGRAGAGPLGAVRTFRRAVYEVSKAPASAVLVLVARLAVRLVAHYHGYGCIAPQYAIWGFAWSGRRLGARLGPRAWWGRRGLETSMCPMMEALACSAAAWPITRRSGFGVTLALWGAQRGLAPAALSRPALTARLRARTHTPRLPNTNPRVNKARTLVRQLTRAAGGRRAARRGRGRARWAGLAGGTITAGGKRAGRTLSAVCAAISGFAHCVAGIWCRGSVM